MATKVLIVEDEALIAMDLEDIVTAAGHQVVGIAPDRASFLSIDDNPQVALVDINLRDGPTGPVIARELSERAGVAIVFITANPQQIGDPPQSAIGYVQKPFSPEAVLAAINAARNGEADRVPRGFYLFHRQNLPSQR